MRVSEGLAGLVAEQLRPVFVQDATQHPRFKYFREAGEDPHKTFLGVPVIDRGVLQGVLVVQTAAAGPSATTCSACWPRRARSSRRLSAKRGRGRQLRHAGAPAAAALARTCGGRGTKRRSACSGAGSCGGARATTIRSCCSRCRSPSSRRALRSLALHGRINYAYRLQRIPAVETHVGRAERQRARRAAGGVLLRGVRPARIAADLPAAGDPGRRPPEERLDLGSLVGVGLYYDQGYFRQRLDVTGWQHEDYLDVASRPADAAGATRTARR